MEGPTVSVKQGRLLGKSCEDFDGSKFLAFHAIPYAKPPVGDLRFKAPQPPESWGQEVRDARSEGDQCFSRNPITQELSGSEDCLTLNVFTKNLPQTGADPRPVMVWIHGGGFTSGSSSVQLYGPNFLMTEDIVLVTINYRLGIFGFLSFDEPELEVPGNAGLKDMVMALKWVQENIANFNGDPKNVTIFGESAGGSAVHHLVLSPMAKGLFHKAIAQSGCATNIWAIGKKGVDDLLEHLGLSKNSTNREILQVLQTLPREQLYEAQEKVKEVLLANQRRPFAVVIENPECKGDLFLSEEPTSLMARGAYNKVPMIMGFTNCEGMFFAATAKMWNVDGKFDDFECAVPFTLKLPTGSKESKALASRIKEFYYKDAADLEDIDTYYQLQSDNWFKRDIIRCFKSHLATSDKPCYLYKFCNETALNIYKILSGVSAKGASHGDDIGYLFSCLLTPPVAPGSPEDVSIRRMVKLWTTFAASGKPAVPEAEWKPATGDELNYLVITERQLECDTNPEPSMSTFWDGVFADAMNH